MLEENKKFLQEKLNLDVDNMSKEDLNSYLDELIIYLSREILKKEVSINLIREEIYNLNSN